MNLTNKHNLPEAVCRAAANDPYSKGDADYSCSELVQPPRITILKQRHADDITEDVIDNLWRLYGKMGHKLLEQAGADNALVETRIFQTIAGKVISGASDVAQWAYHDGKITDYKFTSVYTAMHKRDRLADWEAAQNIYRWLFLKEAFEVTALEICAFYRDWKEADALRMRDDYPPPVEIIPLRVWTESEAEHYIRNRLQALIAAEGLPDDQLPECTADDMWERPTLYAVWREGNKNASKQFRSRADAEALVAKYEAQGKKGYYIEDRAGARIRCDRYCSAAPFCSQYKSYLAAHRTTTPARTLDSEQRDQDAARDLEKLRTMLEEPQ